MNKKTTILLLAGSIFGFLSCGKAMETANEKLKLLTNKAEKLDSMINVEMNLIEQLDSMVHKEMEKIDTIDSAIEKKNSRLDSLINNQ